jgi:DNA repair protein RecN (Recombination protein N)
MLSELLIQNLAIVEQARLCPGLGLTVVSGETGAGKSLVLDGLALVSGERAQGVAIGPKGTSASVTAVFQPDAARAARVEAACGKAASEGQFILRRRLGPGGRSQAWINDVPVTLAALRAAAAELVTVHAQHQTLALAEPAKQLAALDAHAGCAPLAADYRVAHGRVLEAAAALAALDSGERDSVRELDYLRFQLRDFEALAPQKGELAELTARHALLSAATQWRDLAAEAHGALAEDAQAVAVVLGRYARRLGEAPDARLAGAGAACQSALEAVREAAGACADAAERLHADPRALAQVDERLNAWHDLERRHGAGDDALVEAWAALRARIAELSSLGERRAAAAAALAAARQARAELGGTLAAARRAGFAALAEVVHGHLADLAMPKARLELAEAVSVGPGPLGTVAQEFLIRTNPGQGAGRLGEVASGGEAARVALALAAALAAQDGMPVLVFDEVDSGIGARLGTAIGGKLARLGVGRTVVAVTHTPHLAAAAHRHYLVRKTQGDKDTIVTVSDIAGGAREAEIADMLGGGAAALAQARELLAASSTPLAAGA